MARARSKLGWDMTLFIHCYPSRHPIRPRKLCLGKLRNELVKSHHGERISSGSRALARADAAADDDV